MAEEKNGYVKLYKKIENWKYFSDPYVLQVFIFCLIHARKDNTNEKSMKDKDGTFETSITEMSNILKKGRPKIYECLKILKEDKCIDYKTVGKITTIRVLKYTQYQDNFVKNFMKELEE